MRREVDWRGLAAVLIVVGVFGVLIIGAVYAGRNPSYTISTEEIATVATVLGAAIGAVAGYIGTRQNTPRGAPGSTPGADRAPGRASTLGTSAGPENRSQGDEPTQRLEGPPQ